MENLNEYFKEIGFLGVSTISILGFATVIFRMLSRSFTKQNATTLIWIVSISALPHLILSLLNYGSWICLGGALIIVTTLLVNRKKFA